MTTIANAHFGIAADSAITSTTIQVCGMKLEVGNKATDWSLSPWDIVLRADYNALADRVAALEAK